MVSRIVSLFLITQVSDIHMRVNPNLTLASGCTRLDTSESLCADQVAWNVELRGVLHVCSISYVVFLD